jgi:hypothetical protein
MSTEFKFLVIDANRMVEAQQTTVRELVSDRIDLAKFKRAEGTVVRVPSKPERKAEPQGVVE